MVALFFLIKRRGMDDVFGFRTGPQQKWNIFLLNSCHISIYSKYNVFSNILDSWNNSLANIFSTGIISEVSAPGSIFVCGGSVWCTSAVYPTCPGWSRLCFHKRIIYVFLNRALFLHWMMKIFETKISKKFEMKWIREKGKLKTKEAC